MSSPYLNNMIIIGCILTYTSVILLGLDSSLTSESNFPYICAVSVPVIHVRKDCTICPSLHKASPRFGVIFIGVGFLFAFERE